jgi:gluconolactonase
MVEPKILASGLRFPEGPVAMADGSIALVEIAWRRVSRVGADGAVSVISIPGGGPNGLAIGPDGAFYCCNNGGFGWIDDGTILRTGYQPEDYSGGRIERIDPVSGAVSLLYDSCNGHKLRGPNDLVFDAHGGFYFTDLGKNRPRERDHGGVYYARADGSFIVEIAHPVLTPNGIGLSPDGRTLYVAETETSRLWAFDIEEPGKVAKQPWPSPHGGRLVVGLPGYQRFDSLAVTAAGNICVATLVSGAITVVSPGGDVLDQVKLPDPMTTNLCFGGRDHRTAYVTLSGTGRLAVLDWPEPGLKLAHAP